MPEPEDRFEDLGRPPRDPSTPTAAERLAEQDRLDAQAEARKERPPETPRPSGRYAWVVGVVCFVIIAAASANWLIPGNAGRAVRGPEPGSRVPAFAAPLATGELEGDANVRQGSFDADEAGAVPACQVRSEQVFNVCELRRDPLVLTFIVASGADCEPQLDRVERMREGFPEVRFAAVFSGEEREDVEQIVRRRGWGFPVAVDRDGAVTNLYGVGVCPTTVFSLPGGKVLDTKLGNLTEDQLRAEARALLRRARSGQAPEDRGAERGAGVRGG